MQSVPAILTLLKMLCGGFFVVGFGFFFLFYITVKAHQEQRTVMSGSDMLVNKN